MRYTQSRVARNSLVVTLFVGTPFEWNGKVLKRPGLDGRNVIVGYKRCRGTGNGQEEDFRRVDGRRKGDAEASRREADAAKLQGGSTPLPAVDSKFIRKTGKRMRCSRAVFARKLRINERTLEKWEQGRAKPNPQAAALVLLVRRYPDTLERLERVAAG